MASDNKYNSCKNLAADCLSVNDNPQLFQGNTKCSQGYFWILFSIKLEVGLTHLYNSDQLSRENISSEPEIETDLLATHQQIVMELQDVWYHISYLYIYAFPKIHQCVYHRIQSWKLCMWFRTWISIQRVW